VSAPVDIMTALTAYGAKAVIEQGRVRLVCRHPVPAELIETARAHKDELRALLEARRGRFEERAANETSQTEYDANPYASALAALRAKCPAYVPEDRWHQAVADATAFISQWGAQAQAFGWTADDLLGLHPVPEQPAANYSRLSRLDNTGLIWLLHSRPVTALTATETAMRCHSGATVTYRKQNKSVRRSENLDDMELAS
jgi:hypothetical protein